MKTLKIKNDIILIFSVIVVAVTALLIYFLNMEDGNYVVVNVNGEETARYSLSEDYETEIITEGDNTNKLVISNGKASVSNANCPDKICVSHREISNVGESIVCLPHKLVISIE